MDLGLTGSVSLIVGGAKGIGRAIAESFAQEGAHVGLLDIAASTDEVAREIAETYSVKAWGCSCDIRDFDAIAKRVLEAHDHLGGLHHVVHAAAIGSGKFGFPFLNLDPSDWVDVLEVNILGAVHVAHAVAPHLVKQNDGSILFLASVAGQMGSQTDPPYSASKAAIINFMQCVAKDLAPHGVRANALSPGMVRTELNRSVWEAWNELQPIEQRRSYEDWAGEKVETVVPLKRWQTPQDIASMAVFLASRRGINVTGQTVNVDGGFVMHC